jgi:hypothetical protein
MTLITATYERRKGFKEPVYEEEKREVQSQIEGGVEHS